MTNQKILNRIKRDRVKEIQLQFSDLFGTIKSFAVLPWQMKEIISRGAWFDGSSIEGFARIFESDMYLKPDINTYTLLPWEEKKTARFICDVFKPDSKPYESDPRFILKKTMEKAKKAGFIYNVGPELEFFLFKIDENGAPQTHDQAGYFDLAPTDLGMLVRREIVANLEKMGFEIEASHHEVAPGQHEIDFKYADALQTADRVLTFKYVVKLVAKKYGLLASFAPKPKQGINGNGMHVHQSLFNLSGRNLFFDKKGKYNLSKIARYFIAGQLAHIKGISAVIAPTVNSYKRLVPGFEAPVYICWGQRNRSALIRIPRTFLDQPKSTRAELRCPDPSCNPYLAFAVMLECGLDGIKNKLSLPVPQEEDVYEFDEGKLNKKKISTLPESLGHALREMEKDFIAKQTFGQEAYSKYLRAKKYEWDAYRQSVSEWEREKYLRQA